MQVAQPQFTLPEANPFRVYFDIIKSVNGTDGRIKVAGIATDNSEDAEGEVVLTNLNPSCLDYLNKYGKFGYNHIPGVTIGDITKAQFITPEEAQRKYGVALEGNGVEVEGWIHPMDENHPLPELQETHRLFKAGSKVGLSLEAVGPRGTITDKAGKQHKVAIPTFIPVVAVTPLPINTNSVVITKSLAKAMTVGASEPDKTPVFICPPLKKAITTTGAIATEDSSGGDTLKRQDLGSTIAKRRMCCGHKLPEGAKYCPHCGELYRSFAQQTKIIKSLFNKILKAQLGFDFGDLGGDAFAKFQGKPKKRRRRSTGTMNRQGLRPEKVTVKTKTGTHQAVRWKRNAPKDATSKPAPVSTQPAKTKPKRKKEVLGSDDAQKSLDNINNAQKDEVFEFRGHDCKIVTKEHPVAGTIYVALVKSEIDNGWEECGKGRTIENAKYKIAQNYIAETEGEWSDIYDTLQEASKKANASATPEKEVTDDATKEKSTSKGEISLRQAEINYKKRRDAQLRPAAGDSAMLRKMKEKLIRLEKEFYDLLESHPRMGHGGTPNITDTASGRAATRGAERHEDRMRSKSSAIDEQKEKIERQINREAYRSTQTKKSKAFIEKNPISPGLIKLAEMGELNQWKRNPQYFFIPGLDKVALATFDGEIDGAGRFPPKNKEEREIALKLIARAEKLANESD